ncbi:MAG: GNAT family N-acetyltransferase [archaeon]
MKKIILKPAEENDAKFIYNLTKEKKFSKYYLGRLIAKSLKEQKDKIQKFNKLAEKDLRYYFVIMRGKEKVGIIDLYKISLQDKRFSLGYGVSEKYHKKGIAKKAVKQALKFAKKKGLYGCEAIVDPKNIASKKVLEKNGFKKIGLIKDYYFEENKYWDIELYWKTL